MKNKGNLIQNSEINIKKQYFFEKNQQKQECLQQNQLLNRQQGTNILEKKEVRYSAKNPRRSVLEEIGNAITHGIGSVFSIVALILMLCLSTSALQTISAIIYFVGLFVMFTNSCLYHSFKNDTKVKRLFRRFDYSSIYLLIGATFAPILMLFVGSTLGWLFLMIQWVIIVAGITIVGIFGPGKFRPLHITLYLVIGWSGLIFLPSMVTENLQLFLFILGGGIIYTLGVIPFAIKVKGSHFIWHFFVLAGAIIQWVGIYLSLFLK